MLPDLFKRALILVLLGAGLFTMFNYVLYKNTSRTVAAHLTPEITSYPSYRGMLVLNDPLRNTSNGSHWQEGSDSNGSCAFVSGAYHVKTLAGGYYYPCSAHNTDFGNALYEVQVLFVYGDCGGLLVRADPATTNFYYFRLCTDGTDALLVYHQGSGSYVLPPEPDTAIHVGLNQTNVIAIAMKGSTFDLYVNHQKIDSVSDGTYRHGRIALVADGFPHHHPTEVVYRDMKVWSL